jgi:glycosyltransferase involved in cell wall biosynthesis
MLGDGKERTGLQLRAQGQGIAGQITWHGSVAEAAPLFPAFDVFVLSSRTEGTPMALFEAMAAGVPVVATAVGGVPNVISSAEAILVPPDDAASLAAAIRDTLGNPVAARERAHAARQRLARDFAVQPWLERYEAVYAAIGRRGAALANR